jgi:hypothetical protein
MIPQLLSLNECLITIVTFKAFDTKVPSLMLCLIGMTLELAITKLAGKSLYTVMLILVHLESCARPEGLVTLVASEWAIITMHVLMGV